MIPRSESTWSKWLEDARQFEKWNDEQDPRKVRAKKRGLAFVNLYAAAKQLADNYPKRFPYLEYQVRLIENEGLAPKLEERKIR